MFDQIDGYLFDKPLLLIGEDGANLINRSTPIAFIARGKYWVNNHAHVLDGISEEFLRFVELYINAIDLKPYVTGTAQPKMNQAKMNSIPVALPPLAEQQRIVAKVDELMTLCDELAAAQREREARRDRLVAATLHRLTAAPADDPTPFPERARFYFTHLPRLTTRPEHIQGLRQTILNLAVQGKLVPQDPHDEPASELLKRIQVEREKLAKEGKISKGQLFPPLNGDEMPFQIPATWQWVRVAEVADSRLGKMLDKAKNKGTLHRYLRNVNVRWFDFDLSDLAEMKFEDTELDEFSLQQDDVLICEGGEPGRSAVWDERDTDIYFQKAIHRVRFLGSIIPIYFVRALYQDACSGRLNQFFTGVGIKHFTGKELARYTFPLPPLAEQQRIVARVDELLALCDELAANLDTVTATLRRLLEAALQEALVAAA